MYIGLTVFDYYNTNEWILRFHKPICILPIFFYKTDEGLLLLRSNCMCLLPLQYKRSNR